MVLFWGLTLFFSYFLSVVFMHKSWITPFSKGENLTTEDIKGLQWSGYDGFSSFQFYCSDFIIFNSVKASALSQNLQGLLWLMWDYESFWLVLRLFCS